MGLGLGMSNCGCDAAVEPTVPAPDYSAYKVLRCHETNGVLVAEVRYQDADNYDGRKILVYRGGLTMKGLGLIMVGRMPLDPHFCEGAHASPIARFVPTDEGWQHALAFARSLGG